MNNQIKLIERVLNEILSKKNIIYEAAPLMEPVPLPSGLKNNYGQKRSYETHPGIDIPVPVGTAVSAIADGVVEVANMQFNRQCGGTIDIKYDNGFWSRFCHMSEIQVSSGQKVIQGQVVGKSGGRVGAAGAGNSQGPHLHFTLKKDGQTVNPMDYVNKTNAPVQGNISNATQSTSNYGDTSTTSTSAASDASNEYYYGNKELGQVLASPTKGKSIQAESKIYGEFGKESKKKFGNIFLPKEKNEKIKSPIKGVVVRGRYNSSCANQTVIQHEVNSKKFYLEYCGIAKPSVSVGSKVSVGTILGKTDSDVEISLYDSSYTRVYIDSYIDAEDSVDSKIVDKKNIRKDRRFDSKPEYYYPGAYGRVIGDLVSTPLKWFEDKYDENGNRVEKRWGSPTEKEQPSDWLNQLSPTYKKKVSENIERIKKIL
jgi:murein DD-endopeptidase MepM/ murein hydrolase activator NlpD